ncbi:Uncharacterized protein HZ326_12506 [Fusarium oxysporum f. sp. albedinis]|nr:Uncharacterized protein HZ326_12506 [Fusarium oxysporum f. sp. albedinis]
MFAWPLILDKICCFPFSLTSTYAATFVPPHIEKAVHLNDVNSFSLFLSAQTKLYAATFDWLWVSLRTALFHGRYRPSNPLTILVGLSSGSCSRSYSQRKRPSSLSMCIAQLLQSKPPSASPSS